MCDMQISYIIFARFFRKHLQDKSLEHEKHKIEDVCNKIKDNILQSVSTLDKIRKYSNLCIHYY